MSPMSPFCAPPQGADIPETPDSYIQPQSTMWWTRPRKARTSRAWRSARPAGSSSGTAMTFMRMAGSPRDEEERLRQADVERDGDDQSAGAQQIFGRRKHGLARPRLIVDGEPLHAQGVPAAGLIPSKPLGGLERGTDVAAPPCVEFAAEDEETGRPGGSGASSAGSIGESGRESLLMAAAGGPESGRAL